MGLLKKAIMHFDPMLDCCTYNVVPGMCFGDRERGDDKMWYSSDEPRVRCVSPSGPTTSLAL